MWFLNFTKLVVFLAIIIVLVKATDSGQCDVYSNFFKMICSGYNRNFSCEKNGTEITTIIFSRNTFPVLDDESFNDCESVKHVTKLSLSGNKIKTITPNAFAKLENLTDLDLSRNEVSYLVAATFQNNKVLQRIDLSGNNITVLDIFLIQDLPLTTIMLSGNPLMVCQYQTNQSLSYLKAKKIVTNIFIDCNNQTVETSKIPFIKVNMSSAHPLLTQIYNNNNSKPSTKIYESSVGPPLTGLQENNINVLTVAQNTINTSILITAGIGIILLLMVLILLMVLLLRYKFRMMQKHYVEQNQQRPNRSSRASQHILLPNNNNYRLSTANSNVYHYIMDDRIPEESAEYDSEHYLLPTQPTHSPQYLPVLGENTRFSRSNLPPVVAPIHRLSSASQRNSSYSLGHVYEEIQAPPTRNFQQNIVGAHMNQPFQFVRNCK